MHATSSPTEGFGVCPLQASAERMSEAVYSADFSGAGFSGGRADIGAGFSHTPSGKQANSLFAFGLKRDRIVNDVIWVAARGAFAAGGQLDEAPGLAACLASHPPGRAGEA